MPGDVTAWSKTASANASADATINWAEGQPKNTINDSARSVMAALASWRDDLYGRNTTGGSGNTYSIALSQDISTYRNGLSFLLIADHANPGTGVTLSADGGPTISWAKAGGISFVANEITSGSVHWVVYNSSSTRFETITSWPHKHQPTDLTSSVVALSNFFAATDEATARAAIDAQADLGFTPIEQGGGIGQLGNKVHIGYSASGRLRAQIDATDIGEIPTSLTDGAGSGFDADLLDGKHASEFAGVNANTTPDVLDYPIGQTLLCYNPSGVLYPRNSSVAVYYSGAGGFQYTIGSGTGLLTGTWRANGVIFATPAWPVLVQRTA